MEELIEHNNHIQVCVFAVYFHMPPQIVVNSFHRRNILLNTDHLAIMLKFTLARE